MFTSFNKIHHCTDSFVPPSQLTASPPPSLPSRPIGIISKGIGITWRLTTEPTLYCSRQRMHGIGQRFIDLFDCDAAVVADVRLGSSLSDFTTTHAINGTVFRVQARAQEWFIWDPPWSETTSSYHNSVMELEWRCHGSKVEDTSIYLLVRFLLIYCQ